MAGGNTSSLAYDAADQLLSLTVSNGSTQVSQLAYGYDANGNRLTATDQSGAATS